MTKWEYKIEQESGQNVQQFGRALRTAPGKTHGIIIDHVGLEYTFKRPLIEVQTYDWIMWDGGPCPVDDDTRVEYVLSNGKKLTYVASGLDWKHHPDSDSNIVKYRVLA